MREFHFSKNDTKVLKGIAIIMMVFHHLCGFPDRIPGIAVKWGGYVLALATISRLCVGILTFLGGYGTYISLQHKSQTDIFRTLWIKIKNLYLNYWKIFVVFVPLLMIFGFVKFDIIEFIKNAFAFSMSYCSTWWYLKSYIVVITIFSVLLYLNGKIKFRNKKFIVFPIIVVIGEISIYVLPNISFEALGIIGKIISGFIVPGLYLLPGFLLGAFCAKFSILDTIKNKAINCCGAVMAVASIIVTFLLLLIRYYDCGNHDYLISFFFVVAQIPILIYLEKHLEIIRKVLMRLGENSMSIWLCHTIICYQLLSGFVYLSSNPWIIVLSGLLVSYFISILINYFFALANKTIKLQLNRRNN